MPGPMVTFHSSRKLSSYLVRAKFYPRGKRYAVSLNVNQTSAFTSSVTHETYKITINLTVMIVIANALFIY